MLSLIQGTNMTKNTKLKSDEFSKQNDLEGYNHLLIPKYKGFVHLYSEMKRLGMVESIYDVTVSYSDIVENELDFLMGMFPKEINFYIEDFDCQNIEAGEKWLYGRWKSKDKLLEKYKI